MKSFSKPESVILSMVFVAMMGLAPPGAFAQIDAPRSSKELNPRRENAPAKDSSPESDNTRARSAASASEAKPGEGSPASAEPSGEKLVGKSKTGPSDALSDEIESASNDPERVRLQLKLVNQLVAEGKKTEAIAKLHSMSAKDYFNPQGFYNIANALARLGDTDGAVSSYRKAIEQRKGRYSRAFNNLGVVLLRQGYWDEAYDALMSALRLESFRYAEASYNLGRLYAARGEIDLAVREWRRALSVDPEHVAAAKALAEAGSVGNLKVSENAPGLEPAASRFAGPAASAKPNSEESAKSQKQARMNDAFTVDPETYSFLQRARTARDHKRGEEALENYRRVIARMGGYFAPANLELGYSLIELKRYDEAVASLLPVATRDGARFPNSSYHLARLYELRGELKLAETNYVLAANSYGQGNSQILLDLSRVREKLGNLAGALASLEQYVSHIEREGEKPEWSAERLAALRQKLATSQPKQ